MIANNSKKHYSGNHSKLFFNENNDDFALNKHWAAEWENIATTRNRKNWFIW